jgi:hypothetical protein
MITVLRRTAVVVATVALAAAGSLSPASAATTNHNVSGLEVSIGCLTRHLCVAVGNTANGHGTVLTLKNGASKRFLKVKGTDQDGLISISCPSSKGCVALGSSSSGGTIFAKIGKSGQLSSTTSVAADKKVLLGWNRIACTSLTSCVVVGEVFGAKPSEFTVATWNGKHLGAVHTAKLKGSVFLSVLGLSCHGSSCLAVGSANPLSGIGSISAALPIHKGKPGKAFKVPAANGLTAVACPSSTTCYAAGNFADPAGVVVTIKGSRVTSHKTVAVAPEGIACAGNSCTLVGEKVNPNSTSHGGFLGVYAPVTSGTPGAVTTVRQSGGFQAAARLGHFAALVGVAGTGPTGGNTGHSEVTTF